MKNKRKKLANLLLKNYILLYVIMTVILIISLITTLMLGIILYLNNQNSVLDNPYSIMKDDYRDINTTEIEKLNGFIEIIDNNNKVIYTKGKLKEDKTNLSLEDFNLIIENNYINYPEISKPHFCSDYMYRSAYNKEKGFMMIIAIPRESVKEVYLKERKLNPKYFTILSICTCTFILFVGFIIYSRVSSKNFVRPLKILIDGAQKISEGDYSARIFLKSKNEFGELRDAFNTMAERIELEKTLKEKSEEARRRLILDISHDLKNPLANIIGYSDFLIKNQEISKEERLMYLNVIQSNSLRANNLITDLFEFSKLQSIDFMLTMENKDICEFLRSIIASYIPQMEEKGFQYDFDIPEESIFLNFDEKNLDRALSNLILNSIKYNPPNTQIYISVKAIKDKVIITLQDNGIGIPKELQRNIFDPFVRVDEARNSKSGGTGLGLAITKSIIEKHGGTISIESDTGKGTKFTIELNNL